MKLKLIAVGILAALSSLAAAQDTGSITGTVRDKSGAVIVNATVTISSAAANITRTLSTNADGDFLAASLPGGTYKLAVAAPGFRKFNANNIALRVTQKARVDVTMEVGDTQNIVVVEGQGLNTVETQSSEVAGTITGKEITQLQLNGRDFTQLVTLVPGVSNQTGQDEGTVGVFGNVQYSFNGGRTEYNNWELDGGDNMDNGSNSTLNVTPSIEAIAEFRVLTSNYGAQYGRNGSGTVEVETKSGTRGFHGELFEFLRNDAFNARNFFDATVPSYKKNDFGYTLGGPVFIPHLFNTNREKTFFFWSENWRIDRVPPNSPFNTPVPSAAERQGNFNDLCPNPTTGSNQDCPINPATGQPFPNNQLPVNPNGQALLGLIPLPTINTPGATIFQANPILPTNWREELVRVDHNFNSKLTGTVRFIHDSWDTITPSPLWTNGGSFPTVQTNFRGPGVSLVTKLTAIASPTLLNEFVFSYTADHIFLNDTGAFQRPAGFTAPGLFNNGFGGKLPGFSLSGGIYNGLAEDAGFHPEGLYNSNPTYTFRDNVSKIVGKHNLVFGAYLAAAQKNELSPEPGTPGGSVNGFLGFSTTSPVSTGNAFADLLMGNISSFGQQNQEVKYYNRYKILEPYLQDDWHATKNLTLNLGLRISLFGEYHELNQQAFNFDPAAYIQGATSINPVDGTVVGNPFNGLVQCGVKGVPQGCMNGHLFNPAPRFGFAWDPLGDGKMAVRGGYGIFFEHTNGNEANTESLENSPPGVQTPVQFNIAGYNNIGAAPGTFLPGNVVSLPKNEVFPYIQQWHLDIEREVAKNTVATLGYVGSKGTHLARESNLNQLRPVPLSQNPFKPGEPLTATQCNEVTNGMPVFTQSGVSIPSTSPAFVNLQVACGADPNPFRPFQGYGDVIRLEDAASSIYHAFQASLRRSVGALQLSFNYTYSHSIDDSSDRFDAGFVNSFNLAANRASSNFDQRHIVTASYIYDLPFFKGNNFRGERLLGGWQWSGITNFSTGTPFTVTNQQFSDNAGVGNNIGTGSFPDVVANPKTGVPGVSLAGFGPLLANPGAFVAPQGLTFGDAGRNFLRNPSQTNFDMALFKHFPIREAMSVEFRAEAFNIFNHTEFSYLGGGAGSAGFNSATQNFTNAVSCYAGPNNSAGDPACLGNPFLHFGSAHNPRILQFALKYLF